MAEIEGTGTEQDRAGRAPAADPAPTEPVPAAQRSSLPMRRASTMPDVSRYADAPDASPADTAGQEGTPAAGQAPRTAALPIAATAASGSAHGATALPAGGPGDAGPGEEPASGPHSAEGPKHPSAEDGQEARHSPDNEPDSDTGALLLRPSEQEVQRRAMEREHAVAAKPALARFLQVLVAVIFPVVVLAGAVRAVASSSFLWVEYHRPGFPADEFGFSTEDRMTYGSYAVDYVLNLAPARYLGGIVNPGGQQLFLDSEVSHMADVKSVLSLSFAAAFLLLVIGIAACIYLARRYKGGIRRALFAGAALTLALIAVLAVTAVLAWEFFFTAVHGLFFADGTWTFRVDDTLIRLFPEQFWTDAAATVGFLVLATTLLTLVLTWPTRRRRESSRAAQDALQARHRAALSGS